jgi:hypothetical protein
MVTLVDRRNQLIAQNWSTDEPGREGDGQEELAPQAGRSNGSPGAGSLGVRIVDRVAVDGANNHLHSLDRSPAWVGVPQSAPRRVGPRLTRPIIRMVGGAARTS